MDAFHRTRGYLFPMWPHLQSFKTLRMFLHCIDGDRHLIFCVGPMYTSTTCNVMLEAFLLDSGDW